LSERKGQSMTEYALILAAVAVVAFVTYNDMGNSVEELVDTFISDVQGRHFASHKSRYQ
jgi:Flp pilus assembly pilin Flp